MTTTTPVTDVPRSAVKDRASRFTLPAGVRRLAGISASLVSTQALTSVLGLIFWTLAARTFTATEVGVAGAAVAVMMLLGSLGTLGLGTLLISRLPVTAAAGRRVLVRTCLVAAGATGFLLALVVPTVAIHAFAIDDLVAVAGDPLTVLGLAVGTGLTSVVLVLDQAVLTVGVGTLQVERNIVASVVKIGALPVLAVAGWHGGMTVFAAWTVGSLVSLALVAYRTRRRGGVAGPLVQLSLLRGLGRSALSHHALNTTLQASLQILPIIVTLLVSAQANAYFNAALMVTGFVFALPYAVAIGLFASTAGRSEDVFARMRLTVPFSVAISAVAYLVMFPAAGLVLSVFGSGYADEGVAILRVLALAGVAFVIKDHYVAFRRVQERTTEAVWVLSGFLVVELMAAAAGAALGGAVGLAVAWVAVLYLEAVVLAVPLMRGYRASRAASTPLQDVVAEVDRDTTQPTGELVATASTAGVASATLSGSVSEVSELVAEVDEARARTPQRSVGRRSDGIGDRIPWPSGRWSPPSWLAGRSLVGPMIAIQSLGVALMAVAAAVARTAGPVGITQIGWIAGQVLVVLPTAARVLYSRTGNTERIVLAVTAGLLLQFSRRVLYPLDFVYHDEFLHLTTLRQIEGSGHLFSPNPLLPVSAYYPGLEIITDGLRSLTGWSALAAGTVVLLAARLLMMVALIGLLRVVTGSTRAATIGSLIYLANPQLLFFNSQFSYQTLALPLAVATVYLFATRRRGSRWSLVAPLGGLAAVVITHHLTAMLVVVALWVWFGASLVVRRPYGSHSAGGEEAGVTAGDRMGLLVLSSAGVVFSVLAALTPGNPVGQYLWSIFANAGSGVAGLAEGDKAKPLFTDSAGAGPADWEQVLLIGSVVLTAVSLLCAIHYGRKALYTRSALAIVLAVLALLYPIIPASHLTVATAETGDRAAGFVFVGIAAAVGWWAARRMWTVRSSVLGAAVLTFVFLGSVVLGSGPTARQLPGPYLISADARSVDADNLAAARWLAENVPAQTHVYADRVSGLLAAAIGDQYTVRHLSTGVDASRLLLDPQYTQNDVDLIRRADIDYLIVDTRISAGLPHLDVYIETGEFEGRTRTAPVPAAALSKFATVPGVNRVYDNGSIVIYDVRGLHHDQ